MSSWGQATEGGGQRVPGAIALPYGPVGGREGFPPGCGAWTLSCGLRAGSGQGDKIRLNGCVCGVGSERGRGDGCQC